MKSVTILLAANANAAVRSAGSILVIFILKHREFKNSVCKMDGIVYSVI